MIELKRSAYGVLVDLFVFVIYIILLNTTSFKMLNVIINGIKTNESNLLINVVLLICTLFVTGLISLPFLAYNYFSPRKLTINGDNLEIKRLFRKEILNIDFVNNIKLTTSRTQSHNGWYIVNYGRKQLYLQAMQYDKLESFLNELCRLRGIELDKTVYR